jgi:hypothetical protein
MLASGIKLSHKVASGLTQRLFSCRTVELLNRPSAMSAKIHADYDPTETPPHPGKDWTRFVCISDTHSKRDFFVPPGDILLHSGDLSNWGSYSELHATLEWLSLLPHPVKV